MVYLISTSITIVLWGYLGCFTSIRYDLLSAARSSQTKCSWVVTFIEHQDISSVIIFVMSNRKEQTKICNSLLSRWLIHNRTVMETNVTILQEENMKLLHNKDAFSFEIAWILLKFYQSGRLRKLQSNARKTNLSRYEKHCSSNNNFNLSKMYGQGRVKLASEGEHFELCNLLFTMWESSELGQQLKSSGDWHWLGIGDEKECPFMTVFLILIIIHYFQLKEYNKSQTSSTSAKHWP